MVPLRKTISFSGLNNLKMAIKAESDNLHQDLISLIFIENEEKSEENFKLVIEFEMSTNKVKKWCCEGDYQHEKGEKATLSIEHKIKGGSLEAICHSIIDEIEKAYKLWAELK
ncbi:hypothetical protein [Echinicola salinicaeni]|uniref:hypothetical protein n=1 Tax=Echinicola salinicaeni TaxID=2762757 RepID=UPI0016473F48|nr:hypothetical protein [Echinicola salinicaeni]